MRRRGSGPRVPDIARAVARGLAAGLPLADAFRRGSEAVDDETGRVMIACADGLEVGDPLAAALAPLAAEDGGGIVTAAIDLQQELGGDLVATLLGIAEGLSDRERLHLEARAATAQARVAARIVPVAPLAAFAVLVVLSPSAASALVTEPAGLAIAALSGSLTLIALVALRRIAVAAGL